MGRWIVRFLVALVGLALLGAAHQAASVWQDDQRYKAPGTLVTVNGREMHLYCLGEGSPTVVLDSGLAGTVLDWSLVQPELSRTTRVCAYDRAGYGWSKPAPGPRTAEVMTAELHDLLLAAHVSAPYVLVGHSLGGLNMQLFASRYQDEVGGLVLVDGSMADLRERLSPEARTQVFPPPAMPRMGQVLASVGLPRLLGAPVIPDLRKLPEPARTQVGARGWRYQTYATMGAELRAVEQSEAQVRAAAPLRSDLPLAVITAPMRNAEAGAIKRELHEAFAKRSTRGELVVATESGRFVQVDQPQLVIETVRRVVAQVQP